MALTLSRPPSMQHMPGPSCAAASCLQACDTQVSHSKVNCGHVWKNGRDCGWRARWCNDSYHVGEAGLEASGTCSNSLATAIELNLHRSQQVALELQKQPSVECRPGARWQACICCTTCVHACELDKASAYRCSSRQALLPCGLPSRTTRPTG